jgi:hypothetical protein
MNTLSTEETEGDSSPELPATIAEEQGATALESLLQANNSAGFLSDNEAVRNESENGSPDHDSLRRRVR